MSELEAPHYLRFARAIALVSIALASGGCEQVRMRINCEHCHCPWDSMSWQQPISCDTAGLSACCEPVEGPLPPPDLAT